MVGDRADHFTCARLVARRDEIQHEAVFKQANTLVIMHGIKQQGCQRFARRIAVRMNNAVLAVATLFTKLDLAVALTVHTKAVIDELPDTCGTLFDNASHHRLITQASTCGQRVLDVLLRVVVDRVEHRSDPALGPVGIRVLQVALGGNDDLGRVVLAHGRQGCAAPGDPRTDHQHIGKDLRQQRRAERDQVSAFSKWHVDQFRERLLKRPFARKTRPRQGYVVLVQQLADLALGLKDDLAIHGDALALEVHARDRRRKGDLRLPILRQRRVGPVRKLKAARPDDIDTVADRRHRQFFIIRVHDQQVEKDTAPALRGLIKPKIGDHNLWPLNPDVTAREEGQGQACANDS